jgi:hypothetical protein
MERIEGIEWIERLEIKKRGVVNYEGRTGVALY